MQRKQAKCLTTHIVRVHPNVSALGVRSEFAGLAPLGGRGERKHWTAIASWQDVLVPSANAHFTFAVLSLVTLHFGVLGGNWPWPSPVWEPRPPRGVRVQWAARETGAGTEQCGLTRGASPSQWHGSISGWPGLPAFWPSHCDGFVPPGACGPSHP